MKIPASIATVCFAVAAVNAATNSVNVCNVVPVAEKMYFNITDNAKKVHSTGMLSYKHCQTLNNLDVGSGVELLNLASVTWSGDWSDDRIVAVGPNVTDNNIIVIRPTSATKGSNFYGTRAQCGENDQNADEYLIEVFNACINNGDISATIASPDGVFTRQATFDSSFVMDIDHNDVKNTSGNITIAGTGVTSKFVELNRNSPFGTASNYVCHGIKDDTTYPPQLTEVRDFPQASGAGLAGF